jgi:hypothetical protein
VPLISDKKEFDPIYDKIKADQNKSCVAIHRELSGDYAK